MNSFIGQALILIGMVAAAFGTVVGLASGVRRDPRGLRLTEQAAYVFSACMILANLLMIYALVSLDFSVHYVSRVGSHASPTWIRIVSLWSSLEGSILFWGAILGCFVAAFTYLNRRRFPEYMPYALGSILAVCVFFAFLIAGPSNPFLEVSPAPTDGPGPNPLLQNHILMIAHPPTLYVGYVGMTIPFGIAVASLLAGRLSDGWLKALRKWTMVPWISLTIGIVLGGWWAYEVLGWGGYWAWDPVENASFLPWLAATGYLHSTVVQERRRMLKAWTIGMVLASFMLTILGTFMTRSGVFNSVHSFTQSSIGPMFLGFLTVVLIISLGLLAGRSHLLESEGRVEALVSRESAFIVNNLLLVIFTFTVLLGTVFPLITEAVRGVKVSVGEPYFDRMAIPIGMLLVFLMGVGPVLPWGRSNLRVVVRDFVFPLLAGVAVVALCLVQGLREPLAVVTFGLCGFAGYVTLREMFGPVMERMRRRSEGFAMAFSGVLRGARRRFGGYVVHLGVVMLVAGIAASGTYKTTAEASLSVGQNIEVGDYNFVYRRTEGRQEPHRFSVVAAIEVMKGGKSLGYWEPALNYYPTQREPVGTPYVVTVGHDDVYMSLLSFERDGSRVGVKIFVTPMVVWIWWSMPLLVLGTVIALWPRRRAVATVPRGAAVEIP